MKKILATGLLITSLSSLTLPAVAADDFVNDCEFLNVQIVNNTGEQCIFSKPIYVHGNLARHTSVPRSLMPGESKQFILSQTIRGPKIILEASCGNDMRATFTAHQGVCVMWAWGVDGEVVNQKNTYLSLEAENGSFFWGRHGSLTWIINKG